MLAWSIVIAFAAFACSAIICWLVLKYEYLHAHLTHDAVDSGPQKYHALPTPRIGGVGVLLGVLAAGGLLLLGGVIPVGHELMLLLLAGIPALTGGLIEDITKKVGVLERLLLTVLSGLVATLLVNSIVFRTDIPGLDQILFWSPFAIVMTGFCVGGVANAVNIIDGYNGLVSGFALIVLAGFGLVAAHVGDSLVFISAVAMAGSLLGFMIWNYPSGKLFLGDGGAYFLGYWLAELAILLVVRNPDVSPWFPVALLCYPIYETLFSIYRKKVVQGRSPGSPDGLHLQMLIYKRMIRVHSYSNAGRLQIVRNNLVAPYVWISSCILLIPAIFLWNRTIWLVGLVMVFCISYTWLYWRIVHWKSPRCLAVRRFLK